MSEGEDGEDGENGEDGEDGEISLSPRGRGSVSEVNGGEGVPSLRTFASWRLCEKSGMTLQVRHSRSLHPLPPSPPVQEEGKNCLFPRGRWSVTEGNEGEGDSERR